MAKRERLGEILIRAGLLDREGLQRALNEQQRWGGPLGQYLVQMDLVSEETLVRALSTQFKLPAVALDPPKLGIANAKRIPREVCERNRLICFRADDATNSLDVAMADPSSLDAVDEVRVATRRNVRPFFAAPSAIDESIRHVFYGDMGGSYGGSIDLSPSSSMREDVGSSELSKRARGVVSPVVPLAATPPPPPLPPPPPAGPEGVLPGAGNIRLPDPDPEQTGDQFHVTMDLPRQEESEDPLQALAHRINILESALARNTNVLKDVLNLLIEHDLVPHSEIASLLLKN